MVSFLFKLVPTDIISAVKTGISDCCNKLAHYLIIIYSIFLKNARLRGLTSPNMPVKYWNDTTEIATCRAFTSYVSHGAKFQRKMCRQYVN